MNILQKQVSEIHQSPFFYHGVIAECNGFKLETYQDGEISYDTGMSMNSYIGAETPKLAETDCCDTDIENEDIIEIYVDKFFAITKDGILVDEDKLIFDSYNDALEGFKTFLK